MTCKLTARSVSRIKKAFVAGASLTQLGTEHDVTNPAIRYHVKGLDRQATPRTGRPRTFDHERAVRLYLEGVQPSEIAKRFGVSRARISQITRAHSQRNQRKAAA